MAQRKPLDSRQHQHLQAAIAPVMFGLSLAFLAGLAVLVVICVDVPALDHRIDDPSLHFYGSTIWLGSWALGGLLVLWPFFIAEAIYHIVYRSYQGTLTRSSAMYSVLYAVFPPTRMCAANPDMHGRMWLPKLGWRRSDRRLRRRLEKRFSKPMLAIALLIMPVLLVEFCMKDQVAAGGWLRVGLHLCTGIIWFSFAAEYILMISAAEKKLQYCKDNWIDLAIILLPLVSFLRTLRVIQASRLAGLAQAQKLAKLARMYRLRATGIKLLRALMLIELVHRVLGITPERKLKSLREQERELLRELKFVQEQIASVSEQVEAQNNAALDTESNSSVDKLPAGSTGAVTPP